VNDGPGPSVDRPPSHKQYASTGLSAPSAGANGISSRPNFNGPLACLILGSGKIIEIPNDPR